MAVIGDLTDMIFGRLKVLCPAPQLGHTKVWFCRCKCGRSGKYPVRQNNLVSGGTQKCRKCPRTGHRKHGQTIIRKGKKGPTPEYVSYAKALATAKRSGRGICERWKGEGGFAHFLADMGKRPSPKDRHQLARRDPAGGYGPDNCFWAPRRVESVLYEGIPYSVGELAWAHGIETCTLRRRLASGMTVEHALKARLQSPIILRAFGETKSLSEWLQDPRTKVGIKTIRSRIDAGRSHEDALGLPPKEHTKVAAFGETRRISQWVRDPRCRTTFDSLKNRLAAGWDAEKAITTLPREQSPLLIAFGETKLLRLWMEDPRCRAGADLIQYRVSRGWSHEKAIASPPQSNESRRLVLTAFGETKDVVVWERDPRCRVAQGTLKRRILRGWTEERAISTPPVASCQSRSYRDQDGLDTHA